MPKPQPTVDDLLKRFEDEVRADFYPLLVMAIIYRLDNPSRSEIGAELSRLGDGKFSHTPASLKQLVGRMDKTFGLIDCVGGDPEDRRYRINRKGATLYEKTRERVIGPLLDALRS